MITLTRRPLDGKVRAYRPLESEEGELVVWWYGGIVKNLRAASVPRAVVFFRRLDDRGAPSTFVRKEIALTHLGLLRIGTIWEKGVCRAEVVFRKEKKLDISFIQDSWSWVSPHECAREGRAHPINPEDYPLYFSRDRNWLLDFPLPNGKNLLVPCLEFFIRCYGRSEEVSRVLATYPWEEAKNRLYAPFDQPTRPGYWPIKLAKRMRNGDVVLLAHAYHDPYAQWAAKSIYAQLEAAFGNGEPYGFVKVAPWFRGPAAIKANGLWINGGKTFLALQIRGCSDPQGQPIQRDRENPNKVDAPAESTEAGRAWDGAPDRSFNKLPEIVDLTDADEPDHGTPTIDVEEDDFEVLGPQRVVIDVHREQAKNIAGKPGEGDAEAFSTGEFHGTGKGVGYASIHARPVLESHGVLRDMWDAMCYLRDSHPSLIKAVEWFTPGSGFSESSEPELIALRPFDGEAETEVSTEIRNWLYYDLTARRPRGVLVARMLVSGKPVYIVEIQRRPRKKKDGEGEFKDSEESFKGLVFVLNDQCHFEEWLQSLLSGIRYTKGVMQRLVGGCPGIAAVFKHTPAGNEEVPCEAAVLNALGKAGMEL